MELLKLVEDPWGVLPAIYKVEQPPLTKAVGRVKSKTVNEETANEAFTGNITKTITAIRNEYRLANKLSFGH